MDPLMAFVMSIEVPDRGFLWGTSLLALAIASMMFGAGRPGPSLTGLVLMMLLSGWMFLFAWAAVLNIEKEYGSMLVSIWFGAVFLLIPLGVCLVAVLAGLYLRDELDRCCDTA